MIELPELASTSLPPIQESETNNQNSIDIIAVPSGDRKEKVYCSIITVQHDPGMTLVLPSPHPTINASTVIATPDDAYTPGPRDEASGFPQSNLELGPFSTLQNNELTNIAQQDDIQEFLVNKCDADDYCSDIDPAFPDANEDTHDHCDGYHLVA